MTTRLVRSILSSIQRQDPEHYSHAQLAAVLAVAAADKLGWPDIELDILRIEAFLMFDPKVDSVLAKEVNWTESTFILDHLIETGLIPDRTIAKVDALFEGLLFDSDLSQNATDRAHINALCILLCVDWPDHEPEKSVEDALQLFRGVRPHLVDAVAAVRPLIQPLHG